ncbi:MAG: hypothetical protein V3V52_07990, partial [Candidatus Adiutricales bacterium]
QTSIPVLETSISGFQVNGPSHNRIESQAAGWDSLYGIPAQPSAKNMLIRVFQVINISSFFFRRLCLAYNWQ